jgi:hypothetical protein
MRVSSRTALAALATISSLYILHHYYRTTKKRKKKEKMKKKGRNCQQDNDKGNNSSSEQSFYKHVGIDNDVADNLPSHIRRMIHKEHLRLAKVGYISLKKPMYDNVYMLDREREPMCTISMKKALWYIRRGIAEWSTFKKDVDNTSESCCSQTSYDITNNKDGKNIRGEDVDGQDAAAADAVKCIRLLFEHNGSSNKAANNKKDGTPSSEEVYLRSTKRNICVSCGQDKNIIRHYIVPYSYRSLLPIEYKSHMSHDIVILCPECHLHCEKQSKSRMKLIESEVRTYALLSGIITHTSDLEPVIEDVYLGHVRSCALALVKYKDTLPVEQVNRYESVVRDYLISVHTIEENDDENKNNETFLVLTKLHLQTACSIKYRIKNPNYISGSDLVVQSLQGDAYRIAQFIIDWRKHFITTVQPKFMPTGWQINNPVICGSNYLILDRGLDGPPLKSL